MFRERTSLTFRDRAPERYLWSRTKGVQPTEIFRYGKHDSKIKGKTTTIPPVNFSFKGHQVVLDLNISSYFYKRDTNFDDFSLFLCNKRYLNTFVFVTNQNKPQKVSKLLLNYKRPRTSPGPKKVHRDRWSFWHVKQRMRKTRWET